MNFSNIKGIVISVLLLAMPISASSQILKKLGKRAERAAERTVERRVERETEKKTDQVLDSILEPGSKSTTAETPPPVPDQPPSNPGTTGETTNYNRAQSGGLEVYTRYDFTPGDELILFDDFSPDQVGDFPAQWNTNGSGEIVRISGFEDKWFRLTNGSVFLPEFEGKLPENFTVEFDMITTGVDRKTSSVARLLLRLENSKDLFQGKSVAHVSIPLAQYVNPGIKVYNRFDGATTVNNVVSADIREAVTNRAHVAMSINGQRLRLWINETKLVDLPRFIKPGALNGFKMELRGLDANENQQQFLYITNMKIAEGGMDIRSQLMKDGRYSTTGIYFESGSSQLRPESMGVLKSLADILEEEAGLRMRIIGHTDADGDDASNEELSLQRAKAVKSALESQFGIQGDRLETQGKGESEPVAENNTAAGKAKNRRVEFVKI